MASYMVCIFLLSSRVHLSTRPAGALGKDRIPELRTDCFNYIQIPFN